MLNPVILVAYAPEQEGAALLIPGCEKFGIKSVSILSAAAQSDIKAIGIAQQLTGRSNGVFDTQEKFNPEYFPHLPSEYLIDAEALNGSIGTSNPATAIFMSRVINKDLSLVLDVQVCKLQHSELALMNSHEDNFISRYKNVSSSVFLN